MSEIIMIRGAGGTSAHLEVVELPVGEPEAVIVRLVVGPGNYLLLDFSMLCELTAKFSSASANNVERFGDAVLHVAKNAVSRAEEWGVEK